MPALPNIGGYGQTTDVTATVTSTETSTVNQTVNAKNIDVVNCDADLVSTAVLVINGNTVDIPGIESDILTAEGNITTLQGEMTTQQTKTQYQTAAANLTTFTGDATVTGLLTPTVTQGKFGFYTKNTSTVFTNPVTTYDLAYTTLLYSTGNVPLTNVSGVFTNTASYPITCMCTVLLTWPANAVGYRTMQAQTSNTAGNVPQNITFGGPLDVPNYASNQYVQEWHFTVVLGVGGNFRVQGSHQSGGSLTSIAHNTTNPFCIQIVVL